MEVIVLFDCCNISTSYPTVKQTMLLQLYCTAFSVSCLPCFILKLLFQIEAKKLMISKGHTYYQSRKLDRVPREAVEELLGITFTDKSN
ncbi:MAG: DUF3173 family protein [Clostridiales bacterium]|nr:DUF3173 family protein [Clostridiales bacterium]